MVPVHVDTSPPLTQAAEDNFNTMLNSAAVIVDRLKDTPDVTYLMRRLKCDLSSLEITGIRDKLKRQFKAALLQGGFPLRIASNVALMFAHSAGKDIQIVKAKHGDSIVVYFLCKTDKSIYELGQMIVSGFMYSVFAAVIASVSPTTVEVNIYITADEVDFRLLCLSSPEDKGWSIAVW